MYNMREDVVVKRQNVSSSSNVDGNVAINGRPYVANASDN